MSSAVGGEEKNEQTAPPELTLPAVGVGKVYEDEKLEAGKVQEAIDRNPVFIVARSTCSYCTEAKRTLTNLGLNVCVVEADKAKDGAAIRAEVHKMTSTKTVPQIFLTGTHIGGCDQMKAMEAAGELDAYVIKIKAIQLADQGAGEAGVIKPASALMKDAAVAIYPSKVSAVNPMFLFPDTVDNRVVRLTSVLFTFASAIGIACAQDKKMAWAALLLFIDYCFLLFAGARASVFASISSMIFARGMPNFAPGTPKQFANLCGTCMMAGAFACLTSYQHGTNNNDIGARVFYAGMIGAAGMQGFINFCVGCLIFGWLIDFKVLPNTLYRVYINRRASKVANWKDQNIVDPAKTTPPAAIHYATQGLPTNPTDPMLKPRDEKDKWMQFNVVKYCHASHFAMPLGTLGLATVWNLLHYSINVDHVNSVPWQIFGWAGYFEFFLLLVIYIVKLALYPKKVHKEIQHPVQGPALTLIGLCFFLLAYLIDSQFDNKGKNLGKILFWLGTICQVTCGTYFPALWLSRRWDEEMINPGWLLPAVGSWVGAFVAPHVGQTELGFFFFGSASVMFLAIWPMTYHKSIPDHNSDVRVRGAYFIWMACPAVAMLAYVSLVGTIDWIAKSLFFGAYALFAQQLVATWPLRFHDEGMFDMTSWYYVFPADVLAAAAIVYDELIQTNGSKFLYVVAVGVACYGTVVFTANTIGGLISKKIFVPYYKWSPLSYMKLTHEAFAEAIPAMNRLVAAIDPSLQGRETVTNLKDMWDKFTLVHDVHAKHEDDVIFPLIESFFPGQTSPAGHEHEAQGKGMESIKTKLEQLAAADSGGSEDRAQLVKDLQAEMPAFLKEFHDHMEGEELMYATPIARKYFNVALTKDISRKVWDITPPKDMQKMLCWVVLTLPFTRQRIRFVRTFMWAMPEKAQLLGLYLYRGVDDVTWLELATNLPDIIPRGLPGHRRYY